jgi:hypothetical protein
MIEIVMPAIWLCFAAYLIWYFTSAKNYAAITPKEAKMLWKIHKQNARCNGKRCTEIKRKNKTIGFQCTCGYRHVQKRPIVYSKPITVSKIPDPSDSPMGSVIMPYSTVRTNLE